MSKSDTSCDSTNECDSTSECDLQQLWQTHIDYEFGPKANADLTMETMIDNSYVNHIPTSMGGMGHNDLRNFYNDLFIPSVINWNIEPISRTLDNNNRRLVDEMIVTFNHTMKIDFLLPNIEPTNKKVQLAVVAIVNFDKNKCKLSHEHIYWDHASLLKQVGLIEDDSLPILGAEQAQKVRYPFNEPSNQLLENNQEN